MLISLRITARYYFFILTKFSRFIAMKDFTPQLMSNFIVILNFLITINYIFNFHFPISFRTIFTHFLFFILNKY